MASKSEVEFSDQDSEMNVERHPGRDEILTEDDICKALKTLKDTEGSSLNQIRGYLVSNNDKFRDMPAKQLDAGIKKATSRGLMNGRLVKSKTGHRFRLASGADEENSSRLMRRRRRRSRRRRGKCRVRRVKRPTCSKYRKRCCRRKRRCRASKHRSFKPVCSRNKRKCCRRVRH